MYDTFGGDIMFDLFPIIFGIIFIIALGGILVIVFGGISQWKKNENSPRLTVSAIVKSIRTNVSRHNHNNNDMHHYSTSTTYYITFEFESGDRLELRVSGKEFGLLADGDIGTLTFQGTRFLDFVREM